MIVTIPETLPSWNKLYAGIHHFERKRLVDYWRQLVWAYVIKQIDRAHRQPFVGPVDITISCVFNNKARMLDPDNICAKLAIDGLKNHVLIDDTAKYVASVTTRSFFDKERGPQTIIHVEPCQKRFHQTKSRARTSAASK